MSGPEKPQPQPAPKPQPRPSRGPDTNATAPRTRFTKRISYGVWGRRAQAAARELYGLFGKQHQFVTLHTYPGHDQDAFRAIQRGISQSVDLYVCRFRHEPTAAQTRVGQQMLDHLVRNWSRLGLDKLIWRGRYTRDGRNWYDYGPYIKRYKNWGLAKAPDKWHRNHIHARFGVWR